MIKGKRNQKEEGSKGGGIPVPFSIGDIKENINLNTNKQSNPSKEQIINQAFKYHSQGNIEKIKNINILSIKDQVAGFFNYGNILKTLQIKEAEILTRKAIELNQFRKCLFYLGLILREL